MTRRLTALVTACALALLSVVFVGAPSAFAASTCVRHYGIDGFNFGVCLSRINGSTVQPELYIDKVGNNSNCRVHIEAWSEDGHGQLEESVGDCTSPHQFGFLVQLEYYTWHDDDVHADAYLTDSHGGFRVGKSGPLHVHW